ncbi:MAG: P-loop NTPase fold protein, partial [Cyanobacteria bacterium J06631_2]
MKSGNNLGKITLFQIMGQNNQKLNQHIEEYLDYYFSLSYPPGFAILLKGEWGCGKTWFINKYR